MQIELMINKQACCHLSSVKYAVPKLICAMKHWKCNVTCRIKEWFLGPLLQHGLTLTSALISNNMSSKVWDEITYPFPHFNGATVLILGMDKYFCLISNESAVVHAIARCQAYDKPIKKRWGILAPRVVIVSMCRYKNRRVIFKLH